MESFLADKITLYHIRYNLIYNVFRQKSFSIFLNIYIFVCVLQAVIRVVNLMVLIFKIISPYHYHQSAHNVSPLFTPFDLILFNMIHPFDSNWYSFIFIIVAQFSTAYISNNLLNLSSVTRYLSSFHILATVLSAVMT